MTTEAENLCHAVMHERDVMVFSSRVIAEDVPTTYEVAVRERAG